MYQKASIDEEPHELSHDPSPDQQTLHEQLSDNQTQDQESQDLSSDKHKSHELQPDDIRSPSFMSLQYESSFMPLQNESFAVQSKKQRKEVVLEQPLLKETETPLEVVKEDDGPSSHAEEETDAPSEALHEEIDVDKNKTPLGVTKEESSCTKEETISTSASLQIPSNNQQQYRSLSVPSCPPQLKSILRRSNAPKSLSLDIHNIEDEVDSSGKQSSLVHKLSVSYNYCSVNY